MAGLFGLIDRVRKVRALIITLLVTTLTDRIQMNNPPTVPKEPNALRIGILGAARIAPSALILPARSHPDVVVAGVAARDKAKGEKYAKQHGIPKVFGNYQGTLTLSPIGVAEVGHRDARLS